jgi:hypothetical protein
MNKVLLALLLIFAIVFAQTGENGTTEAPTTTENPTTGSGGTSEEPTTYHGTGDPTGGTYGTSGGSSYTSDPHHNDWTGTFFDPSTMNTGMNAGTFKPDDGSFGTNTWDHQFEQREREYQIGMDTNQLQIQGEQKTAEGAEETRDYVQFYAELNDGSTDEMMNLKFEYTYDGETDISTNMELRLCGIVEYVESGMTEGFQSAEDMILQKIDSLTWASWEDKTPENEAFYQYEVATTDGTVGMTVYFTDSNATVSNGVEIDANQFKFDLKMKNIAYLGNADAGTGDSKLAVCMKVGAEDLSVRTVEDSLPSGMGYAAQRVEVESNSGLTTGYFSWNDYVELGNDTTAAIVTTTDSDGNYWFTIESLEHPSMILWDPALGVQATTADAQDSTDGTSAASTVQLSVFGVLLLVLALFV